MGKYEIEGETRELKHRLEAIERDLQFLQKTVLKIGETVGENRDILRAMQRDNDRKMQETRVKENEEKIKKLQEENKCLAADIQYREREYWNKEED